MGDEEAARDDRVREGDAESAREAVGVGCAEGNTPGEERYADGVADGVLVDATEHLR